MSHNRKTCPECQFETNMDEVSFIGEAHAQPCSKRKPLPSISEAFEGDNSSLKKTFEEVVYEATPFSPGVLTVGGPAQKENEEDNCKDHFQKGHHEGINLEGCKLNFYPAQKEDPFSDFMKSQGINVVDVTPTQKEGECICHARAENPKAPLDPQCAFHLPKEDTARSASSLKSNAPKV